MKLDEIKSIVKLMSENDLTEFKIEMEGMHLCIRRGASAGGSVPAAVIPAAVLLISLLVSSIIGVILRK